MSKADEARLAVAWLRKRMGESKLDRTLGWIGIGGLSILVIFGTGIPWLALFFGGWR